MSDPERLAAARRRMIEEQLYPRGVRARWVLAAMQQVPRERFMPADVRDQAYEDRASAIDCGQTISQPLIVGLMTQALHLTGKERVLEIGTGSGYQTAILAELAEWVVSVERHADLSLQAGPVLAELGYDNIKLVVGDGTLGWPAAAPYERIIVTAAAGNVPPALFDQLAEGGVLVIPIGSDEGQSLEVIRKIRGRMQSETISNCRFVPLVGASAPEKSAE